MKTCPRCGEELRGPCLRCLADAALAPTFDASLSIGGKYWLGDEVGRGGMGRVFRAYERPLDRTVALKFIHLEEAISTEQRATLEQRFEREARAIARLSHPNIVQVYEHGHDEGEPYLAMEWVEGESLATRLKSGRSLAAEELAAWGKAIASSLSHAHARGVLHRDIKPSNIVLVGSHTPKLIDFGIACSIHPDPSLASLTRGSQVAGTPGFLAPEALQGVPAGVLQDVYALGATLYTLTSLVPETDAGKESLVSLLERAMSPSPEDRPESMEAFERALTEVTSTPKFVDVNDDSAPRNAVGSEQLRSWNAAAALLFTATAAVGFWAAVLGVTPKVVKPGELLPLTHFVLETLPDGRQVSRARFEAAPWIVFVLALGLSVFAFGFLRAQWRKDEKARPHEPSSPRGVIYTTVAILLLRGIRFVIGSRSGGFAFATTLIPIVGGALELAMLFFFFSSVLDRALCRKNIFGDVRIWAFATAALLPPTHALYEFIRDWKP